MDKDEAAKRGNEVRRWLMGKRFDEMNARRTAFTEEWMEFVSQYAFGEVWARPGLDKKTRHMLTIAMLTALERHAVAEQEHLRERHQERDHQAARIAPDLQQLLDRDGAEAAKSHAVSSPSLRRYRYR